MWLWEISGGLCISADPIIAYVIINQSIVKGLLYGMLDVWHLGNRDLLLGRIIPRRKDLPHSVTRIRMPHTQIAITIRIPRVSTIRILDPVRTRKLANAGWLPKRGAGQLWCIHEGGTKIAEIAVEPVWVSEQKAEGTERIGCSGGRPIWKSW